MKTATDRSVARVCDTFKKPHYLWHNSINRKHIFLSVKFKVRLSILFTRKNICLGKSGTFHEDDQCFIKTAELKLVTNAQVAQFPALLSLNLFPR